MLAVMVSRAQNLKDLAADMLAWVRRYGGNPDVILAHAQLVYDTGPKMRSALGRIRLIGLADLWELEADALGETAAGTPGTAQRANRPLLNRTTMRVPPVPLVPITLKAKRTDKDRGKK